MYLDITSSDLILTYFFQLDPLFKVTHLFWKRSKEFMVQINGKLIISL